LLPFFVSLKVVPRLLVFLYCLAGLAILELLHDMKMKGKGNKEDIACITSATIHVQTLRNLQRSKEIEATRKAG
jgi:hypothetical protein